MNIKISMRNCKQVLPIWGGLLLLNLLLNWVFITWLAPNYKYSASGFEYSCSMACVVVSSVMVISYSWHMAMLIERGRTSDLAIVFLSLLYFFPASILCAYCTNDLSYYIFVCIYFFLLYVLNEVVAWKRVWIPKIVKVNWIMIAFTIFGMTIILISGRYTHFRISFNLSAFHEYRMQARQYVLPIITGYILAWTANLLPIGICYCLIYKKWWMFIFLIFTQILCFSYDGKRSVFFTLFLTIGIALIYKDKYKNLIPYAFCFAAIGTGVESKLRGGVSFIGTKFIRRMMFVPPRLGGIYFDYFSVHEPDYLRASILRRLGFVSPYGNSLGFMIGSYLDESGELNANTGLCGDAFANFRWISLVFYPLMTVLVVKALEISMKYVDARIRFLMSFLVAYIFVSGTFFKTLLTNGIIILYLMFRLTGRRTEFEENVRKKTKADLG